MKIVLAAVVGAVALASPAAAAVTGNDPTTAWVTDGNVTAIAATPQEVLIGGDFTLIGRHTGSWVSIATDGTVPTTAPAWDSTVTDAAADGAGGWFLLTEDEDGAGVVVHLRADRTVDPKWKLTANADISALAVRGTTVFLGGSFTKINGLHRNRMAAIDSRTHKVLPWDPDVAHKKANADADVTTLALSGDGSTLYVAGDFGRVGTAPRAGLAAVAADTGKPTPWKPRVDGAVYTIVPAGPRV